MANSGSYEWTVNEVEEHDLCLKVMSQDQQNIGFSGVFHVRKKIKSIKR